MKKLLPVLFLMLAANEAWAAHWVTTGENDKIKISVDVTSIRQVGNLLQFWAKNDFIVPERMTYPPYKSLTSVEYQMKTNCKTWEVGEDFEVQRFDDGTDNSVHSPLSFEPIVPDSLTESIAKFACNFKRSTRIPKKSKARYF